MDIYPDYKFVCSQAQQFEWLKEYYPKLFDKVKEKVSKGQFLPIGGVCTIIFIRKIETFVFSILNFSFIIDVG